MHYASLFEIWINLDIGYWFVKQVFPGYICQTKCHATINANKAIHFFSLNVGSKVNVWMNFYHFL